MCGPGNEGRPVAIDLLIAGLLSSGMALYHFWLPAIFGWSQDLKSEPILSWALLSINAFFSYLLLAGGIGTTVIALRIVPAERAASGVQLGMLGFWILNASYQVIAPMPLPRRLAALRWGFLAFAIVIVALYATALGREIGRRRGGDST